MAIIKANTLYTGKAVLRNAFVVCENDKIKSVSTSGTLKPDLTCRVMTPAFIDPHSHIGLIRQGEPENEGEANDRMDSIIAHADVLDSVQMDDAAFAESVRAGVLYSCVLPGSGNILSGTSAFIRNYGSTTTDALIARCGIKGAFGFNPMSTKEWKGTRPYTRMGALAILRKRFSDVKIKIAKKEKLGVDDEVIERLLKRKEVFRVHVHKTDDIASLLRFTDEFGLDVIVEHASDVHDGAIFAELKKRKIPVLYGPMDSLAYKVELKHDNEGNVKVLVDSGVDFGLITDHPVTMQKTLFLALRWFVRAGLSREEAVAVITRRNAEILKVNDRLGTIEKGKWASFVCFNGDPFDITRYPVAVYGEGRIVHKGR